MRRAQNILDKLAAVSGVSWAAIGSPVPMSGRGMQDPIFAEDHACAETQIPLLRLFKIVSPGLPKTMGNSLIAGRDFTWTDIYEKRDVAMVSKNLARDLWRTPQGAIGKRIRENPKASWREKKG